MLHSPVTMEPAIVMLAACYEALSGGSGHARPSKLLDSNLTCRNVALGYRTWRLGHNNKIIAAQAWSRIISHQAVNKTIVHSELEIL